MELGGGSRRLLASTCILTLLGVTSLVLALPTARNESPSNWGEPLLSAASTNARPPTFERTLTSNLDAERSSEPRSLLAESLDSGKVLQTAHHQHQRSTVVAIRLTLPSRSSRDAPAKSPNQPSAIVFHALRDGKRTSTSGDVTELLLSSVLGAHRRGISSTDTANKEPTSAPPSLLQSPPERT